MAEIKVNIKGDDSDLKAKFRESSAEARIFEEQVKKSLDAIGEASKNVVSETGMGGIAKLLGGAGLIGAAEEFTSRIVDGFKSAVTAALDFGKQIGQLRSALGGTFGGQAEYWADQIRTISGAMGNFETNLNIFRGLLHAGMIPQDAYNSLINIQNAAKTLGLDLDQLGEKFAEIKERPEEMSHFFRSFPILQPIVQRLGGGETPSVDWMFRTLLPAIAPGGLQAPIRMGAEQSVRGQFASLQEEMNKQLVALGQDLLPIVNAALKELKNEMPAITGAFKALGDELERDTPKIVSFMHEFFGTSERLEHPKTPFGRAFKSTDDFLAKIESGIIDIFTNPGKTLTEAAEAHKQAAIDLHRAVNPK
jgi:hypothetical protein